MLRSLIKNELIWMPEKGVGFYQVPDPVAPYDASYFEKYRGYADTEQGRAITQARIDLVARHFEGQVLDVGIGSGHFVESRQNTLGDDVNPHAIHWLSTRGLLANLYSGTYDALTFWDSLEHLSNPEIAIDRALKWVFVSIPIFRDCDHLLSSRHFRKDEHYWYFTDAGLVAWFEANGFVLVERNDMETQLGRDSIMSYAFRRIDANG